MSVETAVGVCRKAYEIRYARSITKRENSVVAEHEARKAYREALPELTGTKESIMEYVGCVALGIQLKVWSGHEASQLLYASQIAMTVQAKTGGKTCQPSEN